MPDYKQYIDRVIELAIIEDIGDGDHSSLSSIPFDAVGKMKLLIKQDGVIAGIEVAKIIFDKLVPNVVFEQLISDGEKVTAGDIAFYVEGNVISLLQSERIVLNVMQRMSGIATKTDIYASSLKGLKTKVLDTRKTTPGMRVLDKMAVKIGGGENHRMGLFDMIMLKDNHIDFAGGVSRAITNAKEYIVVNKKKGMKIEVEVRSMEDIKEVLDVGGVSRIMLDNFSIERTKEAVKYINGRCEVESSGGITLDSLRNYAECGVDFISVGALTHQIESIDMSLKYVK